MRIKTGKSLLLLLIVGLILTSVLKWYPIPEISSVYGTRVYSSDSVLLGMRISKLSEWRFKSSGPLPENYLKTLLHQEDRYFFYHPGVNPTAIARAAWVNLKAGKVKQGGSTITMQLARMLLKNKDRSLSSKLEEVAVSFCLEARYSKKELLQQYASLVPMGGNLVGIEAGCQLYFGSDSRQISFAQAALLTLLPNNPGKVFPGRNIEYLRKRRDHLLISMVKSGKMPKRFLEAAIKEPLPQGRFHTDDWAPHFVSLCAAERQTGGDLFTSLKFDLQKRAQNTLERFLIKIANLNVSNAALLIAEVESQKVLAWVGNSTLAIEGREIDMLTRPRSYGSLLKPFLYGFCLSDGLLLPHQWVADVPKQFGSYHPQNASGRYVGLISASAALAASLNVPAVDMLQQFGYERFHTLCLHAGLKDLHQPSEHYGLSIILGGAEVRPVQIAGLYLSLANQAKSVSLKTGVHQWDFSLLKISPLSASFTVNALKESRRPNEFGEWVIHRRDKAVSWKTGTSFGSRDAWCVGFDEQYLVLIWLGNASGAGKPGISGLGSATPLFFEVMDQLPHVHNSEKKYKPKMGHKVLTCAQTGFPRGLYCPEINEINLDVPQLKVGVCPYHKPTENLDKSVRCSQATVALHLDPVTKYYTMKAGLLPLPRSPEVPLELETAPVFLYPRGTVSLAIPRHHTEAFFIAEALPGNGAKKLYWHLGDHYLGSTITDPHQMKIVASAGEYRLVIVNEKGAEHAVTIKIPQAEF